MKYREPRPRPQEELERALRSDDVEAVCHALVEAAYHHPDGPWVQAECTRLSRHPDPGPRRLSALCLGHLARIHGALDAEMAEELLTRLARGPEADVRGTVEDARGDVGVFLGRRHLT